ncbi:MAG: hypothetical protein ABSG81_09590, partial [Acidimicrobiales bacterium]
MNVLATLGATAPLVLPKIAYLSILPELVLLGGAVGILATSSLVRRPLRPTVVTAMTVAVSLAALSQS